MGRKFYLLILGLALALPQKSFGLTYRIDQKVGGYENVPTPSGSASLIFPEPRKEEAYIIAVYSDPYFPDLSEAQGLAHHLVSVPHPSNTSSYEPVYQLELEGHSFRFLLSRPSGKHDWQNPMAVNPLSLENQGIALKEANGKVFLERLRQGLAMDLLKNLTLLPLQTTRVSVAEPPVSPPATRNSVPYPESLSTSGSHRFSNDDGGAISEIPAQTPPEAPMSLPAPESIAQSLEGTRSFYVDVTGLNLDPKWQGDVIESGGRMGLERPAKRIAQGEYLELYLDADVEALPEGILDMLLQAANEAVIPRDIQLLGEPTDVDGNGRIVVFLTPVLKGTQASGFTILTDLFPKEADPEKPENSLNPFSNEAEVFYAFVPEDASETGLLLATMAHELAHLIYFGHRIVDPTARKNLASEPVTWFTEALAYLAEDISGYGSEPSGPKQLALFSMMAFPSLSLTGEDVFTSYDLGGGASGDSPYRRGLGYLFLKFLFDREGGITISKNGALEDRGGISWLGRVFSYAGLNQEMRSIEEASRAPFAKLLQEWYATLILEGVAGFKGQGYRYKEPVRDPLSSQEVGVRIYGPNDTGSEALGGFGRVYFTGPYIKKLETIPSRTPALDWGNPIEWVPFGSVLPQRLPVTANIIPTAGASFFELVSTNGPKETNAVFSTETPYPLGVLVVRVR